MVVDNNFKFKVSLSKDAYVDKVISGAMIGTTKDQTNKEIRKQYGFKANQGIGYIETEVTTKELYEALISGKVMCHLFNPTKVRKDGTFGSSEKKDENFVGSYVIGVDIDDTNFDSMESFIDALSIKPTFGYTTYSNGVKGVRFRLIYVLDEMIFNKYDFRYAAWKLYQIIESDTKEEITDKCGLKCSQYFNGTNKDNKDLIFSSYYSGLIYNQEELGCCLEDYYNFVDNYFYLKTKNKEVRENRELILNRLNSIFNSSISTTLNDEMENPTSEVEVEINDEISDEPKYDERLLNDWDRLDFEEFRRLRDWENYRRNTKYYYRVEKDEWINGTYQFVDDNYFSLFWNSQRVKDGSKRRKGLFQRMCLRKVINPEITPMELVVNTIIDIIRFYDNSDNVLNSDFIKRNVDTCMELSLDEILEKNESEINYLKASTRPKKGIIYFSKKVHTKETTYLILDDIYNKELTVTENIDNINLMGYSIHKSTIYEYLKSRELKTDKYKISNSELLLYTDFSKSAKENYNIIKGMGYKLDNKRYNKLYKSN